MSEKKHYTETIEYEKNVKLSEEIVEKAGIVILTCGNCGAVILHPKSREYVRCYQCREVHEQCDMPDLFYYYR